ncbi:hypothetical protein OG21DRAFT_1528421, partial [Imleria badia]
HMQAVLELVPDIIGRKEDWAFWMWNKLYADLATIPKARTTSPQPRLLGSLRNMLFWHYCKGRTAETLSFNKVSTDNSFIMEPEYMELPENSLPGLEGVDMWWKVPPPSGYLQQLPRSTVQAPAPGGGQFNRTKAPAPPPVPAQTPPPAPLPQPAPVTPIGIGAGCL